MKNLLFLSIFIIGLSSCAVKKEQGETTINTPTKEEMPMPPAVAMEPPPPPPLPNSVPDIEENLEISLDGESEVDELTKVDKQPEEIFKIVEEMPRFPGCEDTVNNSKERATCAEIKFLQFIQKNIHYPEIAKANKIQGRCYVTFIVKKNGTISNVKLLRDIGGGCGAESLRVVNELNKQGIIWTPGRKDGQPVAVQYNLPVHFHL